MKRVVRALTAFHRDEGGVQGLELLLIVAAIVLPLLGLLIIFRNELWNWVRGLWGTTLQEGQQTPLIRSGVPKSVLDRGNGMTGRVMPNSILDGSLLAVVAAAALLDLTIGRIPNGLTYPAAGLGLALGATVGGWAGLGESAVGFAIAFGPLFVLYRMGAGLGGGDVKLLGAVGALGGAHYGWPFVLVVLFFSFIVAAVMGVVLMIWRRQTWGTLSRIGRTLKSVMIPGATIVSPSAPESIQVPFAVCVCLGTAWHLIEVALGRSLWDVGRGLL